MTHTLHRYGSYGSLKNDFVFLTMAATDINKNGSVPKMQKFFEIILKHDPVNYGEVMQGNRSITSAEKILNSFNPSSVPHGVFTSVKKVREVLQDLKEADESKKKAEEKKKEKEKEGTKTERKFPGLGPNKGMPQSQQGNPFLQGQ